MKNERAKTRPESNPYSIWKNNSGWTWKILKHYQTEEKEKTNPFARVFCAVTSPFTYGQSELGDVYLKEIKSQAVQVA